MPAVRRFLRRAGYAALLCGTLGASQALAAAKKPPIVAPALVFEAKTGMVLFAEEADTPWYPASLTKLMTAYIVFDMIKRGEISPEHEFAISPRANLQPKSRVGMGAGKLITVQTALEGLIVHSANDFAVALAEAVSGSEEDFVAEMNETALKLGMTRTKFVNANGLPQDGQATTARDMGLLARALIKNFPEWLPLYTKIDVQIGKRSFHTHNKLLEQFDGADGMKTGFTCGAGYNLVASATRNGRKIVAVVLGDRTGGERSQRAMRLLEAAFETPVGQTIDAKTIEPEPVEGEALLDAPLFAQARNLSALRSIKNCWGDPPPAAKPPGSNEAANPTEPAAASTATTTTPPTAPSPGPVTTTATR